MIYWLDRSKFGGWKNEPVRERERREKREKRERSERDMLVRNEIQYTEGV